MSLISFVRDMEVLSVYFRLSFNVILIITFYISLKLFMYAVVKSTFKIYKRAKREKKYLVLI